MRQDRSPVSVFLSYSHEDNQHRIRLDKSLRLLQRQGHIDTWSDGKLRAGDQWEDAVREKLEAAKLILLLVSDDFIASDFIWSVEMTRALERQAAGQTIVVPVIVRPCDWKSAPFGKLQAVPDNGLAVTHSKWGSEDEAWSAVAESIRLLVDELEKEETHRLPRVLWDSRFGSATHGPDPSRYLEALERRNHYLEIRGMGAQVAEQLPLDRVYTRLRVASTAPPGRDTRDDTEEESLHGRDLELRDVLLRSRSAVLIGDPGSGKTTFLRFVAQVLARAWLQGDTALVDRELGVEASSRSEIPFPILVQLSRFAEFLRDHPDPTCAQDAPDHFMRYLDYELNGRNFKLPSDYLRSRVTSGQCFLLLDGLDEVPGELRSVVAAIISELVATESSNRHLVTCRTRAYRGLTRLGGLSIYPLAPFSLDQIATFVHGWSLALFQVRTHDKGASAILQESERYEKELLDAIESHEDVGPLTESPLMLTMLAVVHWSQKKLPERRNELYEEAVKYLLDSRKDQSPFPAPLRREALQMLALSMFLDQDGVQRTIGLQEAGRMVAPVLQVDEEEARRFLDDESLQSGLLVSRTEGEVEFWHLSFQEYLAALELYSSGDYWGVLQEGNRLYDDRWNEVILLLAGCLRRLGGLRAPKLFVERILETGSDRVSCARAVALVGRVLVDIRPYGGDPSVDTEYLTALNETLSIFRRPSGEDQMVQEDVRVEVGEALGYAGDPRLKRPETNLVLIPGGIFWMGAQKHYPVEPGFDREAFDDEAPVHQVTVSSFRLGRYPVTVQEFQGFVDAGEEGYASEELWNQRPSDRRPSISREEPRAWKQQLRYPNRPVVGVSWYEADAYCRWAGGRLPSEAEWEIAARGMEGRRFPWGDSKPDDRFANFGMSIGSATPVGIYPLGGSPSDLHDLAGNVREWCLDWCTPYPATNQKDPMGPEKGTSRVVRGGSFGDPPSRLRSTYRVGLLPTHLFGYVGFRLCLPFEGVGALGSDCRAG